MIRSSSSLPCARSLGGGLGALVAALAIAVAAPAAAADWFSTGCTTSEDLHPEKPTRLLLRVLRAPGDPGFDAVLLRLPDGHLAADTAFFSKLGISATLPAAARVQRGYYDLDRFPELDYAIDHCNQTLSVDAARLMAKSRVSMRPTDALTERGAPRSETGGFVQIDSQYSRFADEGTTSTLAYAGLFGANQQIEGSALFDDDRGIRLDTFWTIPDPQRLQTLRVGDAITDPGPLGAARRFGGIQWGTDFTLQPSFVSFPLPSARGLALLPSTVDVYVNDVLRGQTEVPAGPFEITDLPGLTGDGRLRLVVTDLLGRSQLLEYDIYTATRLLRGGLSEYSLTAGFPRESYGVRSGDYGEAFASAVYRRGLSDNLTIETQAEASQERYTAAAGYALLLPGLGTIGTSLAAAGGDSHGGQLRVGAERIGPVWSLRAEWQETSRGFLRIGETQPPSRSRSIAGASWQRPGIGSLSASWLDELTGSGERLNGLLLGYNPPSLLGFHVSLNARYDFETSERHSAFLLLSRRLGARAHVGATMQLQDSRTTAGVQLSRNPAGPLGWYARAAHTQGELQRSTGSLGYTHERASLSAAIEDFDGEQAYRAGVRTGIVALGRDLFWTRPLAGPFAIVDTGGTGGVRVFSENHPVGDTDDRGLLLVPDLRAYQANRVSVRDDDYALDARIDRFAERIVAPGFGGVRVPFRARGGVAQRLRLQLPDGTAPPAGADIVNLATGQTGFLGFDGAATLEAAPGSYHLQVRWMDGACIADVRLRADAKLGDPMQTVPCRPQAEAGTATRDRDLR